ncbi:MAG: response regulator transcription factor [Clostridia bacterium]
MIYCVEDDKNIRELILYTLKSLDFECEGFVNSETFFERVRENLPDIVLLDVMLQGQDGLEILKKLKTDTKTKDVPVIMVSAKGSEFDKVTGLDFGADDYIPKPFGMMELVSRIKAVLRRSKSEDTDIIEYKNIKVNRKKHEVYADDTEITLSFKEYELLNLLLENKGIVLTRDQILNSIWGYDYDGENRTVDVHIRTLRQKLGENLNIVQTIRNVGYKIGGE